MVIPLALLLAASSPPSGWWVVDASSGQDVGKPGAAWQFGGEVVTIDADRLKARRTPLSCAATTAHSWHCERSINLILHLIDLTLRSDGELVVTLTRSGEPPYGQMNARRARPDEATALDALAAQAKVEDVAACGQAKRCYDAACPTFGDVQDPCIFERHSMSHDATSCTALIPLLVNTLQAIDKPVPEACRPSMTRAPR